ncbi:hypothetical protein BT96DRAFT_940685 [Gymnopus androsaceus JB14]|uniref:Uncharacterized protein n=1 Tax=Gymnopus androsaceus JB14 TaxID=1447944 RepID=A0A6A4HGN5_9AGAR|nr:hypothetical protein BT96DRAFT_940685 [Gymnopus androsaceus JB14]
MNMVLVEVVSKVLYVQNKATSCLKVITDHHKVPSTALSNSRRDVDPYLANAIVCLQLFRICGEGEILWAVHCTLALSDSTKYGSVMMPATIRIDVPHLPERKSARCIKVELLPVAWFHEQGAQQFLSHGSYSSSGHRFVKYEVHLPKHNRTYWEVATADTWVRGFGYDFSLGYCTLVLGHGWPQGSGKRVQSDIAGHVKGMSMTGIFYADASQKRYIDWFNECKNFDYAKFGTFNAPWVTFESGSKQDSLGAWTVDLFGILGQYCESVDEIFKIQNNFLGIVRESVGRDRVPAKSGDGSAEDGTGELT